MKPVASFPALMLLATLIASAAGCGAVSISGGEQAACAAPDFSLEASPDQAAPGESFRLQGKGFFGDYICNDTGSAGEANGPSGPLPDERIRIEFVQGPKTWDLGTVSSRKTLTFDRELTIPVDAEPGKAVIKTLDTRASPEEPGPPQTTLRVLDSSSSEAGAPRENRTAG